MTPDQIALYDDVSKFGVELWRATPRAGNFHNPKMMSGVLFQRMWSHHRGYAALLNAKLHLEGDIILRAGVEAAICIAANFHLKDEFMRRMFGDAVHTVTRQIIQHRDSEDTDMVREGEATLRVLRAKMPDGAKAAALSWKDLAKDGQVPQLYGWYKMLSSTSSHVTGLSIVRSVEDYETAVAVSELRGLTRQMHPMMMIGAMLQGSFLHALMIEREDLAEASLVLVRRLDRETESLGF